MIQMGGSYLVQSVPAELNMDHTTVLQLAEVQYVCFNGSLLSTTDDAHEKDTGRADE